MSEIHTKPLSNMMNNLTLSSGEVVAPQGVAASAEPQHATPPAEPQLNLNPVELSVEAPPAMFTLPPELPEASAGVADASGQTDAQITTELLQALQPQENDIMLNGTTVSDSQQNMTEISKGVFASQNGTESLSAMNAPSQMTPAEIVDTPSLPEADLLTAALEQADHGDVQYCSKVPILPDGIKTDADAQVKETTSPCPDEAVGTAAPDTAVDDSFEAAASPGKSLEQLRSEMEQLMRALLKDDEYSVTSDGRVVFHPQHDSGEAPSNDDNEIRVGPVFA